MTTLILTIDTHKKLNLITALLQELKIKFEISNTEFDTKYTEDEFVEKINNGRKSKRAAVCNSNEDIEKFIESI